MKLKTKMKRCRHCGGTGMEIDHRDTGEQLRKIRMTARISLRDMAGLMGITASYLSDMELGRRYWHTDKIQTFTKLCSQPPQQPIRV